MAGVKTNGIVIKQSDFGDGDRMLHVFTEDFGIIKAVARGAKKLKSKSGSSGQFLCYGEFNFFCGGEIWNINSFTPKEDFEPLQLDFKKLALANYLSELTIIFLNFSNPDKSVLRLLLNTLFACAYKDISPKLIKLVFELKLLSQTGFRPVIDVCSSCSSERISAIDIPGGGVVCKACERETSIKIAEDSLVFLRYFICCDVKKMFAYQVPEDVANELSYISEKNVLHHADREIKSLDYYKKIG